MALFRTRPIMTAAGIASAMACDPRFMMDVHRSLERHCSGDWGMCARRPSSRTTRRWRPREEGVHRFPVQSIQHRMERDLHHHGDRQVGDDDPVPGGALRTWSEEDLRPTLFTHL